MNELKDQINNRKNRFEFITNQALDDDSRFSIGQLKTVKYQLILYFLIEIDLSLLIESHTA